MNKYKDEVEKELDKIKQEQFEIEKTCLKLFELRDNVRIVNKIICFMC